MSELSENKTVIPNNIKLMPDGRLLLVGGNHNVGGMFNIDAPPIQTEQVKVFLDSHRVRAEWTAIRGIEYSQWVFPDPIVFEGVMPSGTVHSVFKFALPEENRPAKLYYPLDVLNGFPDRQSLTDSHYSWIGDMYVAAEVASTMLSIDMTDELAELYARRSPEVTYTGDLGVQCSPPMVETRMRQPRFPGIQSGSNGVQAGNMGIIQLVLSPNSRTERTLLIFGDSFFRSLLPELARYWRRIVFLRTQFFHFEMVGAIAPDDIVSGMAERYFSTTRADFERPHFLAYPLILGRGTAPDSGFASLWDQLVDSEALARN